MLTPESMVKVRILGSKSQLKKVISELYSLKSLHITEFSPTENFGIGKPFKEADIASKHLVKLRSMISFLKIQGDGKKVPIKANIKKMLKTEREFERLSKSLEELSDRKNRLGQAIANPVSRIATSSDKIVQTKSLKTFIGVVDKSFLDSLQNLGFSHDITKETVGNKVAIILTVPAKREKEAVELLGVHRFEERPLPDVSYGQAMKELDDTEANMQEINSKFVRFKKENESMILNMERSFTEMTEKSEAPLSFMSSKRTFAAEGWVPKGDYETLDRRISNVASNKVSIEILDTEDSPPVKLNNPKISQPFEELLNMYSYPKNHEFDPTVILLFTFSAFFGFMLGDIGYGLVLLLLSASMFFKSKDALKSLSYIMMFCSVSAIAFGVLFGEFFGFEIIHPLIHRAGEIETMIMISIAMGLAHITAGLALGFVTKYRQHGLSHAIFEKGSWMVVEAAAVALAMGMLMSISLLTYSGVGLMVLGVLMLLKGEGIKGVIELPGLMTNVLSYIRLFAVGLASVSLAVVVNEKGGAMLQAGGIWAFAAILVFALGHTINILLGVIGPFLQTLRLHYFEFFAKFLEGGGRQYFPFGKMKKWR